MSKYTAYTSNADGSINVLAGSDRQEVFPKILPEGTDYEIHEGETYSAGGKTWLTPGEAYQAAHLADVKAAKIRELKGIRDTKEVEPIQTGKGLFDYDDKSRDRLSIARQALADVGWAGEIIWTTADNQRVPLTVADFAEINTVAAQRSNALHVTYNELKERVNAAETESDVKAIEWPEGDENA